MIYRIDVIPIRAERTESCFPPLESVLLRVEDRDGLEGWGECATAPAYDGLSVKDVLSGLTALPETPVAMDALAAGLEKLPPQSRCALETALLDLRGKRLGVALADLLGGRRRDRVEINALLPGAPLEHVMAVAERAWARGVRTFKLKSGTPPEDGRRLGALRARFGDEARLRLDAGGRWAPDEAVTRMAALRALGLEYVEQPISPGRLEAMAEIAARAGVPVAADEDVREAPSVRKIAALQAATVIIVKLPPAGGPTGALQMIEAARASGLGAVVTGMMETSIGLAAALHVAAAAVSPAGGCGIGTAEFLARDVRGLPASRGGRRHRRSEGAGPRRDARPAARREPARRSGRHRWLTGFRAGRWPTRIIPRSSKAGWSSATGISMSARERRRHGWRASA